MRKAIQTFLLTMLPAFWLHAQDTLTTQTLPNMLVVGTRFAIPAERSGKVIFKLPSDQLQAHATVADALNDVPGIQMDGNFGAPGTNLSYYMRGGRSKQTLIMLDGVPMNDPSGIDPYFDLRFVSLNQVDQIEILQGGLSTLYGSGASAGLINIQTRKEQTDGIHGMAGVQGGSWNTIGEHLTINGKQKKLSFQLSANNLQSMGYSAAAEPEGMSGYDKDGFNSRNGLLKIGYEITPSLNFEVYGGIDWFDTEYDAGPFVDGDDSQRQQQNRVGTKITKRYSSGFVSGLIQHMGIARNIKGSFPTQYDGSSWYGELTHRHEFNPNVTILSGVNFQRLCYAEKELVSKDTTSFTIVDPYTSLLISFRPGFTIHAGVRLNTHSDYGTKWLYNINPSWKINLSDEWVVKPFASLSTAYITPTLFQLHTPWGGNENLKPEESVNYEYGVSVYQSDKLAFTAVSFYREERSVIGYTTRYENISDARMVNGITMEAAFTPVSLLTISADFSWVKTDDPSSFYRIPARKFGAKINIKPIKTMNISVRYHHTGSRTDLYFDESFNAVDINLSSYNLVDFTLAQELFNKHISIYASLYNLFDEAFTGVYGYTTRGRNFTAGINYRF